MKIFNKLLKVSKFVRCFHYIGQDYYLNKFCPLVHDEIFRNSKWYSAYTPYQSEISQGRLEFNFLYQKFIENVTGLGISNGGLLDHSHSLFEAVRLSIAKNKKMEGTKYVLIDSNLFNNLKAVISTYNELIFKHQNISICYVDFCASNSDINDNIDKQGIVKNNIINIIVFSSDKYGFINKNYNWINNIKKEVNCLVTISGDLMHHLHLKSHKELGADIAIGNIQRMGIPLFLGGPHGGYFAVDDSLLRLIPGRIVNISKDIYGDDRYRLALQTREQHIKKFNATSNICTNQALITNYMVGWCMYYGKNGLINKSNIIFKEHRETLSSKLGIDKEMFLDSITVNTRSKEHHDMYYHNDDLQTATVTDIHDKFHIEKLIKMVRLNKIYKNNYKNGYNIYRDTNNFLNDDIFNIYEYNPLEFMRYIKSLEKKDFCLSDGMIPLGSCTMKYNPHGSINVINRTNMNIHPYITNVSKSNLISEMNNLKHYLQELTGFRGVSLQPMSGSHSELTALLIMKKYFNFERDIMLIPDSAHGTNPASVNVAGCKIVIIKHLKNGKLDMEDLKENIDIHKNKIMGLMITHPSTYGFFDDQIDEIIKAIKSIGGLIYLDGANMNSWVGKLKPNDVGFDMMHINLHKTFVVPHGGGGPGVGVLCVKGELYQYLPNDDKLYKNSIGRVSGSINGNTMANLISLDYIKNNINRFDEISSKAVFNANYIKNKLNSYYDITFTDKNGFVAHELIINLFGILNNTGLTENDISKRLIDYGIHPPTMSWPVNKCLMIEPTESESIDNLNYLCDALINIKTEINEIIEKKYDKNDNVLKNAPHTIRDLFDWNYPYEKEKAYYPLGRDKTKKFWGMCNKIDNTYGDKKLLSRL